MIIAKTHDDFEESPHVPMITGPVPKRQKKESLSDAFASAASAIAKVLSPTLASSVVDSSKYQFCPSKRVDLRMKNLVQLCKLKQPLDDGILTHEELNSQKKIVLMSLNNLA